MINLPSSFKLIFRAIAGSNLYGTNTSESDIDERGVFIPDEKFFYGFLNRTEQYEDKNNDITYFEIRKFMQLAMDNNPNIIELLFIPKDKWISNSVDWLEIYKNRDLFVSKKAKFTFSGYAHSQFNRIKLHRNWLLNPPKHKPTREEFGLSSYRSDLTKDQIGALNVLVAMKLENIKEFHPLKEQLEQMQETYTFKDLCKQFTQVDKDAVQTIVPISDQFIDILQRENAYAQAERHYNQYENWKKNRNPTRAKLEEKFGIDTKHTSHLVRLITECEELLLTGNITFPRPDAKFLLEIKNGLYTYEELSKYLESYDDKFNELYEKSTLPHSPDKPKIDDLCRKIVKRYLLKPSI
jgi:uncharacterized protein